MSSEQGAGDGPRTLSGGSPEPLTLESLLAHRELYRSLAANLPRGSLHIFDQDLRFLFAGGPALDEHGFDAASVEGRTLWETVPDAAAQLFAGYYRRALSGETVEFDYATSTGAIFHTRIRPVRGFDGSVVAGLLVSEDVSQERRLTAQLHDTAAQLRSAQRLAGLGTLRFDLAGGQFELNDELKAMWGLPLDWTDGRALHDHVHPEDVAATREAWRTVVRSAGRMSHEHRILRASDGEVRHLRVELEGELGADGSLVAVRGTQLDITDVRRAQVELAQAQQLSRAVLAASPDLTVLVDVRQFRVLWSSGDRALAGRTGAPGIGAGREELLEQLHPDDVGEALGAVERLQHAADGQTLSLRFRVRARGAEVGDRWRWLSIGLTPFRRDDRGVVEAVCVVRDIHDVVEAEQRLHHAAHHDALTGLPNRTLLLRTWDDELITGASGPAALLYIDLDHFKRVNDQFGHAAGDSVLITVAQRLQSVLRASDLCARVGGDEFVVLITDSPQDGRAPGASVREQALLLAERLRAVAAEPIEHNGHTHVLAASVGIRLATAGLTAEEALRDADSAMYLAKQQGRDRQMLFQSSQRLSSDKQAQTEHLLRQGLGGDGSGLGVAYQPIFDVGSGRLLSVEALARLSAQDGSPVEPADFIGIAEQTGLIGRLGEVVLERACTDLREWRRTTSTAAGLQLAVNLSARQAQDPALSDSVLQALVSKGLRPSDLVLELTETVLLAAGLPALRQLRRLRNAGVDIAIDDFGTGYASLRYLATLPVTALKVDRTFTAGLPGDAISCTIVKAVAGLAADMGLTCVVEGIETPAQLGALPGGVQGQGFHLGRPTDAQGILALLNRPSVTTTATASAASPAKLRRPC